MSPAHQDTVKWACDGSDEGIPAPNGPRFCRGAPVNSNTLARTQPRRRRQALVSPPRSAG
jgi:hypothetical protein